MCLKRWGYWKHHRNSFNVKTIPNETFSMPGQFPSTICFKEEIPGDSGLCPSDRGKRDWEEAGDQTLVLHPQVSQVFVLIVLVESTFLWSGKEGCRHGELSKEEKASSQEHAVLLKSVTWPTINCCALLNLSKDNCYSWVSYALQRRTVGAVIYLSN